MRFALSILALVAALFAAAFLLANANGDVSAQETVTITMGPGRDASQTGTATLTAQGNQTQVVINIQSGGAGVQQPAHIHQGSCPGVGAVAFPLTNVVDGTSTTMVNATLASLRTGSFSINVHRGTSQADLAIYVSCGNIPAAAQPTPTPAPGTPTPAATPIPTPAQVPTTGGPPTSDDGAFAWWYVAVALAAVAALGSGAFLFAPRRHR